MAVVQQCRLQQRRPTVTTRPATIGSSTGGGGGGAAALVAPTATRSEERSSKGTRPPPLRRRRRKGAHRNNRCDGGDDNVERGDDPFGCRRLVACRAVATALLAFCGAVRAARYCVRWLLLRPAAPPPEQPIDDDDSYHYYSNNNNNNNGAVAATRAAAVPVPKQQPQPQQPVVLHNVEGHPDDDGDEGKQDESSNNNNDSNDDGGDGAAAVAQQQPPQQDQQLFSSPQWWWNLSQQQHPRAPRCDAYALAERLDPGSAPRNNKNDNHLLAAQRESSGNENSNNNSTALFWQTAADLRRRFAETYGGGATAAARAVLERAVTTFSGAAAGDSTNDTTTTTATTRDDPLPDDVQLTACRILRAAAQDRPYLVAFGGYSVTAGRGNYFAQSYPLQLERILQPAFAALGLQLRVRNAAVGGCPSFPYGWCLRNFLGGDSDEAEGEGGPDAVSWDYSMNEAGGHPAGLEAYVRHVLTQPLAWPSRSHNHRPTPPPQLIVMDTHMAGERRRLLQRYASAVPLLKDCLVLHADWAAEPFLRLADEQDRPAGFRDWRRFGAPPHAPGQSPHHPAVPEHLLLAWILALHLLRALQVVAASRDGGGNNSSERLRRDLHRFCRRHGLRAARGGGGTQGAQRAETTATTGVPRQRQRQQQLLPKPLYQGFNYSQPWTSILFGEPAAAATTKASSKDDDLSWKMNAVHCRTSFEPIVGGNLSDIIVAGSTAENMDVLLPKSKQFYNRAFVLDMSDAEKQAKRNLLRYNLGFVDGKKAYYGIYASGTLQLLLPHEEPPSRRTRAAPGDDDGDDSRHKERRRPQPGDRAADWFKSVVVCEVNEQRASPSSGSSSACQSLARDVHFTVGGRNATVATLLDAPGTVYLGKKLCLHLLVPETATLTSRRREAAAAADKRNVRFRFKEDDDDDDDQRDEVGLLVTAKVHNQHIVQRAEACSISHVVWEQRDGTV